MRSTYTYLEEVSIKTCQKPVQLFGASAREPVQTWKC
jgi:hypothetical protein